MLAWLADFTPHSGPLNVFRYITFRTGGAIGTALLVRVLLRAAHHLGASA